ELGLVADELAARGAPDGRAHLLRRLLRDLPPGAGPELLADDVLGLEAAEVERGPVDLDEGPVGLHQPDELEHRVEEGAEALLRAALGRLPADGGRRRLGGGRKGRSRRRTVAAGVFYHV